MQPRHSLEMVPAVMSLLSFSSYNTSRLFLSPLPLVDLLSGQNSIFPRLVWCNAHGEWYTSAKLLLMFPTVPEMAWTEP